MFAVSLILLSILVVAVAVVLIVALPQLRSGSEIFTEDGKQAVARAGQAARTGPVAVVGSTKQLLRPVSEKLHAQIDRLDDRQNGAPRETAAASVGAGRRAPSSGDTDHSSHPVASANPAMVSPRSVPAESGPIPELPSTEPVAEVTRDVVPPRLDVVIDLRELETGAAPTRPIDKPIEHRAGKRTT